MYGIYICTYGRVCTCVGAHVNTHCKKRGRGIKQPRIYRITPDNIESPAMRELMSFSLFIFSCCFVYVIDFNIITIIVITQPIGVIW